MSIPPGRPFFSPVFLQRARRIRNKTPCMKEEEGAEREKVRFLPPRSFLFLKRDKGRGPGFFRFLPEPLIFQKTVLPQRAGPF